MVENELYSINMLFILNDKLLRKGVYCLIGIKKKIKESNTELKQRVEKQEL